MSQWGITILYPDFSNWILNQAEMDDYTEGWNSSTLIISPHLLLQLPRETKLIACMTILDRPASESKLCHAFNVIKPRECDSCFSKAPDIIDEFQTVIFKPTLSLPDSVKSQSGLQTISISKQSTVCSLIPYSDSFVTPCIKSLPGSDVYIEMCFRQIGVISKLVTAIEKFSLEREESLLPFSSALEALARTSTDMSFHAVNRLKSKLEISMNSMKSNLARLSRRDILLVSERFVKFGIYLFEGMSQQRKNPLPSLNNLSLDSLAYDTDIDSEGTVATSFYFMLISRLSN
ncbi:hypothetical protein ACTXT7_015017 [Hymenolepis weldensis]